jgi:hypothetical protein
MGLYFDHSAADVDVLTSELRAGARLAPTRARATRVD